MSTDYTLKVTKKSNNSKLIECYINQIKCLYKVNYLFNDIDSGLLRFDRRSSDTIKFKFSELESLQSAFMWKISAGYEKINKLEFQKCCSKTTEIKHDFEQDMLDEQSVIEDLFWAYSAVSQIIGIVNAACEQVGGDEYYQYIDTEKDIELEITAHY